MKRSFGLISLALMATGMCAPAMADETQVAAVPSAPMVVGSVYWGTGFFVDRDGHVLTAYHLVSYCASIQIVGNEGRETASVVASNPANDVSVLKVSRTFGEPAAFDTGEEIGDGAMVAIVGYRPLQEALRSETAAEPAVFNSMVLDERREDHIALVSDAEAGASGSPVISRDGLVIGILQAKVIREGMPARSGEPREIRLALDGATARDFLRQNGISPIEGGQMEHARLNVIGGLAAAEVKVECHR